MATTASGLVSDIHRASLHDGPGVRTTVFLHGCPLRCSWCHNAEYRSCRPVLRLHERDCLACGACVSACQRGRHAISAAGHVFDRAGCTSCGDCVAACPSGALSLVGQAMTADEVLATVLRDRGLYASSGGGMTLSGGEPLAQPAFALALLAGARAAGVHTCVESSGHAPQTALLAAAAATDLWLFDVKAVDDALHRRLTGVGSSLIHANLDALLARGAAVELRCPLVPGLNDGAAELDALAAFVRARPALRRVWLMPYHRMGVAKAAEADERVIDQPSASADDHRRWLDRLAASGVPASIAA
ncbi:MAG TPA: glycyl-radical enzyme activating protein [Planctomycetes bacterium]|nr:glycyl-radical enzyme activating protein [Planctomycetota bacterium]